MRTKLSRLEPKPHVQHECCEELVFCPPSIYCASWCFPISPQTGKTCKYSSFSLLTELPGIRSLFSPWLTSLQLRWAGTSAIACQTRHLSVFAWLPLQESEWEYMLNKKITHLTTYLGVLMPLCFNRDGILFPECAGAIFQSIHTQRPWIILQ